MRALPFLFSVVCCFASSAVDPATVLVIVQDNTAPEAGTGSTNAGQWVADHYMTARGIPAGNILHVSTFITTSQGGPCSPGGECLLAHPSSTNITYQQYLDGIETPLIAKLAENGGALANSIKYIVTTYGVPVTIASRPGDPQVYEHISIDSQIAAINQTVATLPYYTNPYYQAGGFGNPSSTPLHLYQLNLSRRFLPVTRLDGPTALIAAGLVDKAIAAERGVNLRSGTVYLDWQGLGISTTTGTLNQRADGNIYRTNTLCVARGLACSMNNQSTSGVQITVATNILAYWGWYYEPETRAYTFAPGGVGSVLISDSAYKIREAGYWVPFFLNAGATATWGVTSEPFVNEYPLGDTLLNHLWNGYTFGEAAYLATPHTAWMSIFLGDPLYLPRFVGPTYLGQGVTLSGGASIQ